MIGTLIGLIAMLGQLDKPEQVGMGMAVALITTLYGAVASNLLFLPIAGKLRLKSDEEVLIKQVMIEGILSIQAGENPRIVEEKLIEASEAGPNRISASFHQETNGDEMVLEDFLGDTDGDYDTVENRLLLKDMMAGLEPRQRQILYLRYVEGLSQSMVGEMLGISQMHVSRLERRTLADLRTAISS